MLGLHVYNTALFFKDLFFMSMNVLPVCMCAMCVPDVYGGQRGHFESPSRGIRDGCELLCGCWKLNPGPLEEQMYLTAQPSLQALLFLKLSVGA